MQKIERLITQSRRDTDNEDYSDTTGIPDASFLSWANRAQRHIQSKILEVFPKAFYGDPEVYPIVDGQEEYTLPPGIFLGTRLEMVECSVTGRSQDYYPLYAAVNEMRRGLQKNKPYWYIRKGSKIILLPPGSTGLLRFSYQKDVPTLDKKRAVVNSITTSCSAGVCEVTALSFTTDLTDEDVAEMLDVGYITLLKDEGEICFYNVKISAIDVDTGAVTIAGGGIGTNVTPTYAVAGKRATNYSQLPETCEDYIAAFLDYKALRKDTATDATETSGELLSIQERIVAAFQIPDNDVHGVPVIDDMYLSPIG